MISSKQLCVLLPILLVAVVIVNQASAVQNRGQLQTLVEKYFVPDFYYGGLIKKGHDQFAIVAFLPNTQWLDFRYWPSKNYDGEEPLIGSHSRSPPDGYKAWYYNYLAARPNRKGEHSEIQILKHLDELYNAYVKNKQDTPKAMLLYSWIVPCKQCTDELVEKLKKEPYNKIPTKVVAYTTNGEWAKCACDADYTKKEFKEIKVEVVKIKVKFRVEEKIENVIARLMLE